jgi:hypothetical protein
MGARRVNRQDEHGLCILHSCRKWNKKPTEIVLRRGRRMRNIL